MPLKPDCLSATTRMAIGCISVRAIKKAVARQTLNLVVADVSPRHLAPRCDLGICRERGLAGTVECRARGPKGRHSSAQPKRAGTRCGDDSGGLKGRDTLT